MKTIFNSISLFEKSTGNESNICRIYALKGGKAVYDDCRHGYKTADAVNVNSVTKGVMALLAGIAGTFKPRIFDRVEFIEKMILPVTD